jgi:hypothetical protein
MSFAWEMPPVGRAAETAMAVAATVPVLESARLRLRAPDVRDFAAYAEIFTSDRARHMGGPYSREGAWHDFCQAVASWMLRGMGVWSIERKADGVQHRPAGCDPGLYAGRTLQAHAECRPPQGRTRPSSVRSGARSKPDRAAGTPRARGRSRPGIRAQIPEFRDRRSDPASRTIPILRRDNPRQTRHFKGETQWQ